MALLPSVKSQQLPQIRRADRLIRQLDWPTDPIQPFAKRSQSVRISQAASSPNQTRRVKKGQETVPANRRGKSWQSHLQTQKEVSIAEATNHVFPRGSALFRPFFHSFPVLYVNTEIFAQEVTHSVHLQSKDPSGACIVSMLAASLKSDRHNGRWVSACQYENHSVYSTKE